MARTQTYGYATQGKGHKSLILWLATPALVIFFSSNVVNLGNLAFNMIFSRLMGPELFGDLALILTIKLALLGVLGALQTATSQLVAGNHFDSEIKTAKAIYDFNRAIFVVLWLSLPVVALVLWASGVGEQLGLSNPNLLFFLLISLPFSGPLNILRGYVLGKIQTGRIVLSANIEMGVRLVGAITAWQMGFGIEGCVAAIALSIIAGWVVLVPSLSNQPEKREPIVRVAWVLGVSALPFAVLQLAQIASLDGDIFLAKSLLDSEQAGFIAALSLFQRIQFFACFALSSILLPSVIRAVKTDGRIISETLPVVIVFLVVTIPVLSLAKWHSMTLIELLVGEEYSEASPGLWFACVSAGAFTLSYLLATFLAALNDFRGIWLAALAATAQIFLMWMTAGTGEADFVNLLSIKASIQCILCAGLCIVTALRIREYIRPTQ